MNCGDTAQNTIIEKNVVRHIGNLGYLVKRPGELITKQEPRVLESWILVPVKAFYDAAGPS